MSSIIITINQLLTIDFSTIFKFKHEFLSQYYKFQYNLNQYYGDAEDAIKSQNYDLAIDILNKSKSFQTAILVSCLILIILALVFITILWKKTKLQKNLENIIEEGTAKMIHAKSQLNDFTSFVQQDKAISITHIEDIKNEFSLFEKTVSEVVNETQNYSFKISHEIQRPINTIQIKLQNLAHYIDKEKENDIKEITEMTQKIQNVIEKLLLLSKIQKFDLDSVTIDVGEQIHDIIDDMKQKYNKTVVFDSKHSLPIVADPLLLKIMWENLISNSIKYHQKDNECRISLDAVLENDKVIYTYQDNGAGMNDVIDQNHFSKNIGVESNKIGLTIVQEIIKKHKGQFSIVNSDKLGTTIRIELNVA